MTIVISAPQGIDISAVAARFGQPVIADPLRAVVQSWGFQTLYEMPAKLRFDTRRKLLADHAAAVAHTPAGVFDHSVFSYLADWMRWDWSHTPTEMWEQVLAQARTVAQSYRLICHQSNGVRRGYDGFHWLDERNDRQTESLMRFLYGEFGVTDRVEQGSRQDAA